MTAITIEKFAGKMNRLGYEAFLQAMRQARGDGNRNVELSHWLFHAISHQDGELKNPVQPSACPVAKRPDEKRFYSL